MYDSPAITFKGDTKGGSPVTSCVGVTPGGEAPVVPGSPESEQRMAGPNAAQVTLGP